MTAAYTDRAWSCTVRLVVDDADALHFAAQDLTALLERVDTLASRFRADSTLQRANACAGKPVPIPRLLVDMVSAALDVAAQTNGAVDPTVGLAMHQLGYDRDILAVAPDGPAVVASRSPRDWRAVRLHREAGLLTVPLGTALDLGATAKAFTADYAARTLSERYDTSVLVELGGDVAVAGPHAWCIQVAEYEGGNGQQLLVRRGGVATSTTTLRTWRRGSEQLHHILDPRTSRPTNGPWRTATVAAESALDANGASTAAIVLGADAIDWLESEQLAARLVAHDGAVVTTKPWPALRAVA